jgi:anaerobic selenocysteine-containing dehydrogenase
VPVFTTACPRNCYSTCGFRVEVEDGRVRSVETHPGNRATGQGVCLKGLSYVERAVSPLRITRPLLRRRGDFQPIGWDEALDLLAARFSKIRAEHGPQSILYYAGSGTKGLLNGIGMAFWRLFGGCTTTYGDLCWPAGLEATRLTLGENKHNAPWDLEHARLIVFWGKNPAETNVHQMDHLARAIARGARVVVVDPRRTETAERAELLLQPLPGTDGALALALAHELITHGWIDRPFIEAHVQGFEAFAALAEVWTPERGETVCGISAASIRELAALMGSLRPFTLCAGFGMQRYTNSGQTMRALLALPVLTGQIGISGGGWSYANLQTQIFGPLKDPLDFYPPERPDGVVRVGVSTARLGRDMLALKDPPLRAAWVERGNPIPQNPETPAVLAAFKGLEFRVVIEEFMTDTAREADLVLPAKNLFEQTDVIGAYWHPYLQLRQKVLEPPPEVKPETEIYWRLGERLGLDPAAMAAHLVPPEGEEAWLRARLAPWPGLTLERLAEAPVLAPGAEEIAFADLRFPTPSGRIELWSDEARTRWGQEELAVFRPPEEGPGQPGFGEFPLRLLTPNSKNRIHSQFGFLDLLKPLESAPQLSLAPDDARARGLRNGDRARVFNGRGSLILDARIDAGIRPGTVYVPNGFWLAEGAVNLLSCGRETDLGHGAAFHDVCVQVEQVR